MNIIQRYIITGCLTAIALFVVWYFGDVVKYILISAVLSLIGKPLVDILSKIDYKGVKIPRWLSATIALVAMWALAILAIWALVPIVMEKVNAISNFDLSALTDNIANNFYSLEVFLRDKLSINIGDSSTMSDNLERKFVEIISPTVIGLSSLFDKIISFIIGAFSVSFITFFFLRESGLFNEGVTILFPSKYEANVRRALESSTNLLSRYFIGLIIESTIKLIVVAVALELMLSLSVSDAVIIALISAILNVIPYIGPIIGAGMGILIAIASPEVAQTANINVEIWKMVGIFTVFQLIDNVIIQPYVYSSSVKAHPLEIFIVILLAGSIAGVLGMLLAIPAYTVIRVFAKEFFNKLRVVQRLTEKI